MIILRSIPSHFVVDVCVLFVFLLVSRPVAVAATAAAAAVARGDVRRQSGKFWETASRPRERGRNRGRRAQQEVQPWRRGLVGVRLLRDQVQEQRLEQALAGDVGQNVFEPLADDARTEER